MSNPQGKGNGTPFEVFFHEVFQPNLEAVSLMDSGVVFSNGHTIEGASWDRRAAYLLWMVVQGQPAPLEQIRNRHGSK